MAANEKKNGKDTAKKKSKKKKVKKKSANKEKTNHESPNKKQAMDGQSSKPVFLGALIVLVVVAVLIYAVNQPRDNISTQGGIEETEGGDPQVADQYDIVSVKYTGYFLNGSVFDTSEREVAEQYNIVNPMRTYEPLTFSLSGSGLIKGFEEAIKGMRLGEEKSITVEPVNAYGFRQDDLIQDIDRIQESPIVQNVSLDKFTQDIGVENPTVGMNFTVPENSFYEVTWQMTVLEVSNDTVTFKYNPEENLTITTMFGPATVYGAEETVNVGLDAEEGDEIISLTGKARVISVDEETITIDFNHPLAGKTLKFDIELVNLVKQ